MERAVVSVGVQKLVAPRQGSANTASAQRVVHARSDVDRAFVVEHSYFGALSRRYALNRVLLSKLGDRGGLCPSAFVELAIDDDRSRCRSGCRIWQRCGGGLTGRGCLRAHIGATDEQNERGRGDQADLVGATRGNEARVRMRSGPTDKRF